MAIATRTEQRRLSEGALGCLVCQAEYVVRDGEVLFGPSVASDSMAADDEETLRAAALLHLEERRLYLLDGGWASLALALQALVDVDLLLADPPAAQAASVAGQGVLRGVDARWPLGAAALHGLALDRASPGLLADAVRVLRPRGRLVAPVAASVPAGVTELARDDRHWVAEKTADVVTLARARR